MQNDCFIVFLWLIQRCIMSLAYLIICKAFLSIDFSVKKWLIGSGMISVSLSVDYLLGMKLHIIFLLLELVLFSHYIFPQLWKKTWQGTTVLLVISEISELLLLFAYDLLFSAEEKSAFNNLELISFPTLKLNLFAALILLILASVCLWVKKILPKLSLLFVIRIPLWLRLCLAAAEIVFLGLWYWRVSDKNIYGGSEGFFVIIFTFLAFFTLLVGLARDIAQYKLEKRNRALGATQQSIATFLFEMRAFRHDIANILYGWQGAVMEGDSEKLREYNSEMSSMFSLINNDNTLNLQKLGSGSIRKLLNEKLHLAEQSGVPAYLLVEGVFDHFRMRK